MPSPKGAYTKVSGPLAGTYASYYQYQKVRAQSMGFPSYSQQRQLTGIGNPLAARMIDRSVSVGGLSRASATQKVRTWFQNLEYKGPSAPKGSRTYSDAQGFRKHLAVKFLVDEGIYTKGDDAADEIPY